MPTRRTLVVLPFLALALVACEDSTAPESVRLTAAEAAALARALDTFGSAAVDSHGELGGPAALALVPAGDPSADVSTREDEFRIELPCPVSGRASLAGEHRVVVDTDQGYITVDLTGSQLHEACAIRTEEGVEITLDGSVSFEAERELREGLASARQSHSGGLDFATSDGKVGRCDIDIATEFTLRPTEAARTILGSVCGHDVEVRSTWQAGS